MVAYAIDCEMAAGYGTQLLVRVSIVDQNYNVVLDTIVHQNPSNVSNYQTKIHGITASQVSRGEDFNVVQNKVRNIISGKILVGHCLHFDLKALKLDHPERLQKDIAKFPDFKKYNPDGQWPSLKDIARHELGKTIQEGVHSSVEDATTAMQIYNKIKHRF